MTTPAHSPTESATPGLAGGEPEQAGGLRRMKMVATSMLVLAAIVFVAARIQEAGGPEGNAWGYLRATAEAAMVGALADWFAVTALFRHPLGIPIPHTAIIKRRKDQIGASLGGFVRDNFLTREIITERLRDAGLARRVGAWMAEPGNAATIGSQSAAVVKGLTEVLADEVVQSGIDAAVIDRARRVEVAPIAGRMVDVAIEGDHHQVLLDAVLTGLSGFMDDNVEAFRERMGEESPWWVPESVDDVVFEKVFTLVRQFLAELGTDRHHEMRREIDRRTVRLARDLKSSPEMIAKGEEIKNEFLDHPEVRAWTSNLWIHLKAGLLEATEDPGSQLRIRLEDALAEAGRSLENDPELQAKIDRWLSDAAGYIAEQFRGEVSDLIATTVQRWDTDETADRIELQVGRDLQFIRINGTLVGGLAGLIIHAVSELLIA